MCKIIRGLIALIHENKELVDTIKNILEVFPEGVIIEGLKPETNQFVVKYVNRVASEDLFNNRNYDEKSIDDSQLEYAIETNLNSSSNDEHLDNNRFDQDMLTSLNSLLDTHKAEIDDTQTSISSYIRLVDKISGVDDLNNTPYYHIKTIAVNWTDDLKSYMHVFTNVSSTKKLEKEKATNKALNMMLSSVSHEFRTPINALSNSLCLLEMNFGSITK